MLFWIIHSRNLNFSTFWVFFFWKTTLFNPESLFSVILKNRSFRGKIYWGFVIIFVHFRYIERYEFCRRASTVLIKTCLIEIILSLRNLVFGGIIFLRLHFLHVLFKGHSFFERDFIVSFKIVVHFCANKIYILEKRE